MRRTLSKAAAAFGADPLWLSLAATELATNALAVSPEHGTVDITVHALADGSVELLVADDGPGPPPLPEAPPPPDSVRGRGLYMVRQLSDSFGFERIDGRTVARCRGKQV